MAHRAHSFTARSPLLRQYQINKASSLINDPVTLPSALSPSGGHPEGIWGILELLKAIPATVLALKFYGDFHLDIISPCFANIS
jgi:hypothetical protein